MAPEPPDPAHDDLVAAREIFAGLVSAYVTTDVETVGDSYRAVRRYLGDEPAPERLHALISAAAITSAALLTQLATHTGVSTESLIAQTAGIDLP